MWELTNKTIHVPLGCLQGEFRLEARAVGLSTAHTEDMDYRFKTVTSTVSNDASSRVRESLRFPNR